MTTATKRKQPEEKPKPALHVQVGSVRIAIWKNASEGGAEYFKAGQPELSYKDREGQWHTGKSYGERDLLNLTQAAALAYSELVLRNRSEPGAKEDAPEPGQ